MPQSGRATVSAWITETIHRGRSGRHRFSVDNPEPREIGGRHRFSVAWAVGPRLGIMKA